MDKKKHYLSVYVLIAVLATAAAVGVFSNGAQAQTGNRPAPGQWQGGHGMRGNGPGNGRMNGMRPVVFGTISSINGTTLTVNGRQGFASTSASTTTTYTVDASSAVVIKNQATSTLAGLAVGDTVAVSGTISGDSVKATYIRDGQFMRPNGGKGPGMMTGGNAPVQGNGQPVIGGKITAVSGSTVTVTNSANVTYSVDDSAAKIVKYGSTAAATDLAVGDPVVVQGAVSDSSVSAANIFDQAVKATAGSTHSNPGFFGTIGNFFKRIFGF